jgi:hypothetical protein
MKLVQKMLFVAATTLFVAQGCNKDNSVNQAEIGTTDGLIAEKPVSDGARFCASHDYNEALMASDPAFKANQASIEEFTTRFVSLNPDLQTRAVVTIPVVVHVVYKTAAENISDAQIQSQIAILNADFRKLNADASKVPAAFSALVADCEVQFCLAQKTPTGAATTGINRVLTKKNSFSTNNAVKTVSGGGVAPWNTTQYLNLWVCTLSNGVLGYAQFPGGSTATDGVVILNKAFGSTGTAAAPFNKGRTATHEVGHWLNLRHIWGDDGGACTGSDLVSDTPNQGAENYGCPAATKASCSNGGDMHMNYMDYTDDACMYMFSAGQKARMQATLVSGGAHYSITTSGKCN